MVKEIFYHDVFWIAIEGGINYWAYAEVTHDKPDKFKALLEPVYAGDFESGVVLDISTLRRAISILKKPDTRVSDKIKKHILKAYRENDASMLDASDADVLVQLGVFGELVFA